MTIDADLMVSKEFQAAKKSLLERIDLLVEVVIGDKGLKWSLDAAKIKMDERNADEEDLDFDTVTLIKATEVIHENCVALKAKPFKKPDLAERQSDYDVIKAAVLSLKKDCDNQLEGIKTKLGHATDARNLTYNKTYWKATKVANQLMVGGYMKANARLMANIIVNLCDGNQNLESAIAQEFPGIQLNPSAEHFDIHLATLITDKDHAIVKNLFSQLGAMNLVVQSKYKELETCMTDSPSWY